MGRPPVCRTQNEPMEDFIMSNFSKVSVADDARTELHDKLGLTGAEVSINNLPAGSGVPFVHSHKQNEEIYVVLSGKGKAVIEGETVALAAGDWDIHLVRQILAGCFILCTFD